MNFNSEQITTVTLFKVGSVFDKFWAFQQVPLAHFKLRKIKGLQFLKSMGSGGGKGFDFMPSFDTYAWLMVWDSESDANEFYTSHPYFLKYQGKCISSKTFYLKNIMSHGKWSKVEPFEKGATPQDNDRIMVLTRARIKWNKLYQFWNKVGRTANELYKFPELEFAIGIGELPFIQQATLSIWTNSNAMKNYAYTDQTHKNVIALTRKYQWYSEELFARFIILSEKSY